MEANFCASTAEEKIEMRPLRANFPIGKPFRLRHNTHPDASDSLAMDILSCICTSSCLLGVFGRRKFGCTIC